MPTTNDTERIAEIEARLAKAPLAPWSDDVYGNILAVSMRICEAYDDRAIDLIVHAPTDLRYLIDRLAAKDAELSEANRKLCDMHGAEGRARGLCDRCGALMDTDYNSKLKAELAQARAALREELRILTEHAKYRTHYEGCERDHPACAAIKRIAAALEALPLREGEACRESINLSHVDRSTKDQPDAEAVARAAVEVCEDVVSEFPGHGIILQYLRTFRDYLADQALARAKAGSEEQA